MAINEDLSDFGLVDEETYRFLDQLFEGDIDVVELQTIPSTDGDGAQFLQVQPHTETVETQPTSTSKQRFKRVTEEDLQNIQDCRQSRVNKKKHYFKVHICSYPFKCRTDMFLKVQKKRLHNKIF